MKIDKVRSMGKKEAGSPEKYFNQGGLQVVEEDEDDRNTDEAKA